jgi:hypothetical protein
MPPKNKAFLISKLRELDPSLDEDELSKHKVVELMRMVKEKSVVPERIEEDEELSLVQRLGCA